VVEKCELFDTCERSAILRIVGDAAQFDEDATLSGRLPGAGCFQIPPYLTADKTAR
jgi:hypothetical protein